MSNKLTWSKAEASNGGGGCVEVADLGIGMRDSKDPGGPILTFTRPEFACFLDGAKHCEFDHLVSPVDLVGAVGACWQD